MEKIKSTLKKWNSVFCRGMACKANVKRDIAVTLAAVAIAAGFLSVSANPLPKRQANFSASQDAVEKEFSGVVAGAESTRAPLAQTAVAAEEAQEKTPDDAGALPPAPSISAEPENSTPSPKPEPPAPSKPKTAAPKTKPKPAPSKPKITAPKPVSFRVVGGKMVCAKKNDKPRKSKQHKGKHLDMECCLDPDETPNPWCTY